MSKHSSKTIAAAALVLISIILVGAGYACGLFNGILGLTVLSISSINVDPQGYAVGQEWTGSFWNMLVSVQANDAVAGVILPKDQTGTVTVNGIQTALKTQAKIEIRIDPGQPYLIRNLVEKTVMVTPDTGRTWASNPFRYPCGESFTEAKANALWLNYYGWSEPSWRIYTPFTVTIYKDGVQVGSSTLNTIGKGEVQTINTGEGSLRIENLGILGGNYLAPNTPAQLCLFKGYPNMYDLAQVSNLISYDQGATYDIASTVKVIRPGCNAYSTYWYGTTRWITPDNPAAFHGANEALDVNSYGGWKDASDFLTYRRDPIAPVIGSSDKSSLPTEKRNFMSLTEYIQSKGVANLAGMFQGTYDSESLVTDSNGITAMKLAIPWGAYGTPMVSIRVPTELADTWVDRPPVSNVQPTGHWEATGTKYVDISGSQRLYVDLKQSSTVLSSTNVRISCGNSKVGLYPLEQTVSLNPQETRSIIFTATNLGVETQVTNVPIKIECFEMYTGTKTGEDTVYATLLSTLSHDTTTLSILAVEKGTTTPIVGLQLEALYGTEQKQGFTAATPMPGQITFTLDMAGGGGYTGQVAIQSVETPKYLAAYQTVTVQPGVNSVTLEVEVKGQTYPTFDWWIIAVAAIVIVFIAVVASVAYKKRKKRR